MRSFVDLLVYHVPVLPAVESPVDLFVDSILSLELGDVVVEAVVEERVGAAARLR